MTKRYSADAKPATVALLVVSLLGSAGAGDLGAADRTLAEFKEYAAGKMTRISEAQLHRFAQMVDQNSNGVISDAEFAQRLEILRKLGPAGGTPTRRRPPSDQPEAKKTPNAASRKPTAIPPFTSTGKATVLLITGDEIASAWQPFAQWKTRNGKPTKIVTVGQIDHDYEANGIQEKIRLCVRDHIDNYGTRWVVLGGDSLPDGLGSGLTTGEALMKAKAAMVEDARQTAGYHLCICELNLLGDPTIGMRHKVPHTPKLACPPAIGTGKQSVEIVTDAPGNTVCLWKGLEVYSVATSGADGKTTFHQVEPASAGDLLVTVFGKNLNSVTKSVPVK